VRLRIAAAFVALLAVASVPVFSTVLPPLVDYPNHLARMHLLAEGGNRYYAVRWAPLPNLAADLIIPPLSRLMPLAFAGKIFLVMVFALLAGGTVWLNRAVTGTWRKWPLLGFLFLYNRLFLWGFVNYLFGLGLALCGLALWLTLERRPAWMRVAASCVAAVACFFAHLSAFGIYALAIAGVELIPFWHELRRRDWRGAARRTVIAGVQFVAPAVIFLAWLEPGPGGAIRYARFVRKFDILFNVFDNYSRPFDVICFVLLVTVLAVLAGSRRLHLAPRMLTAIGLVFVAYLAMPSQLLSGSGADHRLPIALFLLVIGGAAPDLSRREVMVFGGAAAAMFAARMAVIEAEWLRADRIYTGDLVALDRLPEGASLAVAYPADEIHAGAIPELHVPTLAAARREAFVPTVFALPSQQPLTLTPAAAALARLSVPPLWWLAFVDRDAAARARLGPALAQYDYVVFLDRHRFALPPDPCLKPVAGAPNFHLAAIEHGPACKP